MEENKLYFTLLYFNTEHRYAHTEKEYTLLTKMLLKSNTKAPKQYECPYCLLYNWWVGGLLKGSKLMLMFFLQ